VRHLPAKFTLAASLSLVAAMWLVPAAAGWHEAPPGCDNGTGVCISIDDNYVVPRAVNCCSTSNWAGINYPNTASTINNSASSVRNGFAASDITFHKGTSGTGDSFCLPQGGINNNLGFFGSGFDDQISSNGVTSNLC
jgi:hypothetical protein